MEDAPRNVDCLRPGCPRCESDTVLSHAKVGANARKWFDSVLLFLGFFVLDVYNVAGERIHIDLSDVL
jgi:hypothetical protein